MFTLGLIVILIFLLLSYTGLTQLVKTQTRKRLRRERRRRVGVWKNPIHVKLVLYLVGASASTIVSRASASRPKASVSRASVSRASASRPKAIVSRASASASRPKASASRLIEIRNHFIKL